MDQFLTFAFLLTTLPTTLCWDFWKLALQWPPAVSSGYHAPNMDFTIHGLWTENFSTPWPAPRCPIPRSPYIHGLFAQQWPQLFQRLQVSWPDVEHGVANNEVFWERQWRSHGGCSEAQYGQVGFFELAVDLKDQYNVQASLVAAGIWPDYQNSVSLIRFNNAITTATSKDLVLSCYWDYVPSLGGYGQILKEVRICFDNNSLVIDCPARNDPSDCSGPFIFFV